MSVQCINDPCVQFALEMCTSIATGNVYKFFSMYREGIKMSQYIIDFHINKMRVWGLKIICKIFGSEIDLEYLIDTLKFHDMDHILEFLKQYNCTLNTEQTKLMLKQTLKTLQDIKFTFN